MSPSIDEHSDEPITWAVISPNDGEQQFCRATAPLSETISLVREFRGRVLHANGRRPGFQQSNGNYVDHDEFDSASYHIVAYIGHRIVGCIRMRSLAVASSIDELFGCDLLLNFMDEMTTSHIECAEVGRWCVDPSMRGGGRVGLKLVAGTWAVLRHLGYKYAIAVVGTVDGQDTVLHRAGLNHY